MGCDAPAACAARKYPTLLSLVPSGLLKGPLFF